MYGIYGNVITFAGKLLNIGKDENDVQGILCSPFHIRSVCLLSHG